MRKFLIYFFTFYVLAVVLTVGIAGYRGQTSTKPPLEVFPDMKRQAKLRPETTTKFAGWSDGQSSRVHPEGSISRETAWEDTPYNTGKVGANFVDAIPVPVTAQMLKRGQERFTIYCQPCHGAQGDGKGITSKFGMAITANLHQDRLIKATDGELFTTISVGKSTMMGYGSVVPVEDRWAIVSYVRTLQLSRLGMKDEVPASVLEKLK
ncbi:MAG TPA: cytochrome c [Candidatus Limnocylindria bacterium]|jgi:mono/diheme cytochrome c family protein|nr:cytochrome c [Candidatus Limnocylindria bacterium]